MIQGVISAAVGEVLGGLKGVFPKPPVKGRIKVTLVLEIKDGKPVFKEASEITFDFDLRMGNDE